MDPHPKEIGVLVSPEKVFSLRVGTYIVGNGGNWKQKNNIVLHNASLDIKHAALVVSSGCIKLIDLFSQHGTYVEARQLQQLEIFAIRKTTKLQFGTLACELKWNEAIDNDLLGASNVSLKDAPIIPNTLKNLGNTSKDLPDVTSSTPRKLIKSTEDSFFVQATQAANDNSLSCLLDDDDDFFIPETQEFSKKISDTNDDSNDVFQINTQDFNAGNYGDSNNETENLTGKVHFSEQIAFSHYSSDVEKGSIVGKPEECQEQKQTMKTDKKNNPLEEENIKQFDDLGETEIPQMIWNEKEAVALDKVELPRSGSVTPDLQLYDLEQKENDFEKTEIFVFRLNPKDNNEKPAHFTNIGNKQDKPNVDKTDINSAGPSKIVFDDNDLLEATQKFTGLHKSDLNKPADSFIVPSILEFDKTRTPAKKNLIEEETELIEPTQIFKPKMTHNSKSVPDQVQEDFEATQMFNMPVPKQTTLRRSPVLLESDEEENNSEFCFCPTLVVSEDTEQSVSKNTKDHTKNKCLGANSKNKLFGSSDEDEDEKCENQSPMDRSIVSSPAATETTMVQPTPDFAFLKLPSVEKIQAASEVYRRQARNLTRQRTLLEESSDEDDPTEMVNNLLESAKAVEKANRNEGKQTGKSAAEENLASKGEASLKRKASSSSKSIKSDVGTSIKLHEEAVNVQCKRTKTTKTLDGGNIGKERDTRDDKNKLSKDRVLRKRQDTGIDEARTPKKESKKKDDGSTKCTTKENVPRKSSRMPKPRILFTKMDSRPYENLIEKIGAIKVENPLECTVLVTDTLYRTWKLLSTLAKGTPIVSIEWLQTAAKCKELKRPYPNYDDHLITDVNTEKRFKFTLRKSLERARNSPIFQGYSFYCTPNTKPPPKELNNIIECAGGQVIKTVFRGLKTDNFFVVSDKSDISLWPSIRSSVGKNVPIINTEGILLAVMQQCISFKSYLLSA